MLIGRLLVKNPYTLNRARFSHSLQQWFPERQSRALQTRLIAVYWRGKSAPLTLLRVGFLFGFFADPVSRRILSPINSVHVPEVTTEISTLRESLPAQVTGEGSHPGMLPVVVSQVATLLEHALTVANSALKVQLWGVSSWVTHSDGMVPLLGHMFNWLRIEHTYLCGAVASIGDYAHIV